MPTLDTLDFNKHLKVLAYGDSGTGKTCFAAGFPGPIKYFDFDGKISSAASHYRGNNELLKEIDYVNLQSSTNIIYVDPIVEFFKETAKLDKLKGDLPFKTLVLDSLTTFSGAMLRHIVLTNLGFSRPESKQGVSACRQDYGVLKKVFSQVIPGLLALPCNVVMLGHIKIEKDESSGEILRQTYMDGSFAVELPIYFEEVYRTYVESGKYYAQTQADKRFKCRTQRGLPAKIELNYREIIKER